MYKFNWTGSFDNYQGYGLFNMNLLKATLELPEMKINPIHLMQFEEWDLSLFSKAGIDFNDPLFAVTTPFYAAEKYPGRVWGLTMYESTSLLPEWVSRLNNYYERVLVPSEFCVELFKQQGIKIPIHLVYGGIDENAAVLTTPLKDRPYTFMALGDRGSRKGHDLVWTAFYKVFGQQTDVRLVLKMRPESYAYFTESLSDTRISFYRHDVVNPYEVFEFADCYVFPSRGEGFGMPPREAAARGIPVIATKWSGLDDNIEKWALPVPYILSDSHLKGGGKWASPDIDVICNHMEWCYKNQEKAREFGIGASNWLKSNRTWKHSARQLQAVIKEHMQDVSF